MGLTSRGNKAFVESIGIYDEVVTYDTVETMSDSSRIAYIDMAGNRTVLGKVHRHFGDNVTCSSGVGITHWDSRGGTEPSSLPGAKPTMFFAPTQIQKRHQEWGSEKLRAEMHNAWNEFLESVDGWVTINERKGADEMQATYQEVLQGAAPDQSFTISL